MPYALDLSQIPSAQFVNTFQVIPTDTDTLCLAFNHKDANDLINAFPQIPGSVKYLSLHMNQLYILDKDLLIKIFRAIALHITSVNIGINGFGKKTAGHLSEILQALHKDIENLSLQSNLLEKQDTDEFCQLLKELSKKSKLHTLDLSGNQFGKKPISELIKIFSAVPDNIIHVNFIDIELDQVPGAHIAQCLRALHKKVSTLDLSYNTLGSKKPDELIQIGGAIDENITHLVLMENNFAQLSAKNFATFLDKIHKKMKKITLSLDDIKERTDEELRILARALPSEIELDVIEDIVSRAPVTHRSVKQLRYFLSIANQEPIIEEHPQPVLTHSTNPIIVAPQPQPPRSEDNPPSSFQFNFLHALGLMGIAALAVGIAALLIVPSVGGLGIGVAVAGGALSLVSILGLFSHSSSDRNINDPSAPVMHAR